MLLILSALLIPLSTQAHAWNLLVVGAASETDYSAPVSTPNISNSSDPVPAYGGGLIAGLPLTELLAFESGAVATFTASTSRIDVPANFRLCLGSCWFSIQAGGFVNLANASTDAGWFSGLRVTVAPDHRMGFLGELRFLGNVAAPAGYSAFSLVALVGANINFSAKSQ